MPIKISGQSSSQYTNASKRNEFPILFNPQQRSTNKDDKIDTIELAEQGDILIILKKVINSIPATDEARIKELKIMIGNGSYDINYLNIAEKLIRSELQ